jgi:hypothetical protein
MLQIHERTTVLRELSIFLLLIHTSQCYAFVVLSTGISALIVVAWNNARFWYVCWHAMTHTVCRLFVFFHILRLCLTMTKCSTYRYLPVLRTTASCARPLAAVPLDLTRDASLPSGEGESIPVASFSARRRRDLCPPSQ